MTNPWTWAQPDEPISAFVVIYDRGGIAGAWLDEDRAHEFARHTQSVVVRVPVVGDYRSEEATR